MQIGHPFKSKGSNDTENLKGAGEDVYRSENNELYVADGYGNHRVIVFDADTGKYKRHWGAYGHKPDDTDLGKYDPDAPIAQQFRNPVHCAQLSDDGLLYVCDRVNDRIQVFKPDGTFVKEQIHRKEDAGRRLGVGHRLFERSRSRNLFIWPTERTKRFTSCCATRCRKSDQFRRRRPPAGQFYAVHSIATDSKGQYLHDGNLSRAARTEIRLQRNGPGHESGSGRSLAEEIASAQICLGKSWRVRR